MPWRGKTVLTAKRFLGKISRKFRRGFLLLPVLGIGALAVVASLFYVASAGPAVLRVGYNEFPPFVIPVENQRPQGLAVEIVERAADKSGVHLQWVKVSGTIDDAFHKGEIDLYPLLTITELRKADLYFSEPWWLNDIGLVSLGGHRIQKASETKDKRIAIRGIGIMRGLATSLFPQAKLVTIPAMDRMLTALCHGEIDGFFLDEGLVHSQLLNGPQACAGIPINIASVSGGSLELGTAASWKKRLSPTACTGRFWI